MFYVVGWLLFGLLVGIVARYLHPGKDPSGLAATLLSGVGGSFIGGVVSYFVFGTIEFRPAGFFMSVIGAITLFALFRWLSTKEDVK